MEIFVNYDQRYGLDIPLIRYLLVKVENGKTDREVKKHGETSVRKPWIPFVATSFFLATQQPLTRVHTLVARFIILTHSFFRSHSHALSFRVCLFPSVCVCIFFSSVYSRSLKLRVSLLLLRFSFLRYCLIIGLS